MDAFHSLMTGFSIALTPQYLMFAFAGSIVGTLVGVLPGVGPSAGIAILIPLTFQLDATGAIIMLCAIFYGTQYGGTITSVLMNVPGEASSAVTCIDGYQMAKKGRAGAALSIAAIGSFIGGTVATIALVFAAPPLTEFALRFGPAETFALMIFGISLVTSLAGKSMVKGLMMGVFGLLLAMVGMDPVRGSPRFTFGQVELMDGVGFIPVIMGLLGLAEILSNAENAMRPILLGKMSSLLVSKKDIKDSVWPIIRGTAIGCFAGVIPGVSGAATSFMSYVAEKKFSKYPEKFGTGVIEGVAGPETGNNAHANAAFIPLFTLGIPPGAAAAVLMGAFIMNGLEPGPFLFTEHPDVVWPVIASMYIGNVILVILNLPLVSIWIKILQIPYSLLFGLILMFMIIGAYSVKQTMFDVGLLTLFGVIGYALKKLDFPVAPAVLTLILGPLMERSLRRALDLSQGDFSVFFTKPISAVLLALAVIFLLSPLLRFRPTWGGATEGEDAEV